MAWQLIGNVILYRKLKGGDFVFNFIVNFMVLGVMNGINEASIRKNGCSPALGKALRKQRAMSEMYGK